MEKLSRLLFVVGAFLLFCASGTSEAACFNTVTKNVFCRSCGQYVQTQVCQTLVGGGSDGGCCDSAGSVAFCCQSFDQPVASATIYEGCRNGVCMQTAERKIDPRLLPYSSKILAKSCKGSPRVLLSSVVSR